MMSSPDDCQTTINLGPFVLRKFRTGSYLIYDDDPSGSTRFRKGTALQDMPFRASGSRQLDLPRLVTALKPVVPSGTQLHLVDLRQESHLFFDGCAVSWYADKDFANVGQTLNWINVNELAQRDIFTKLPLTQIYCITEDAQAIVTPTGYSDVRVKLAAREEDVAATLPFSPLPKYTRIPVTDHCMPGAG